MYIVLKILKRLLTQWSGILYVVLMGTITVKQSETYVI